MSLHGKIVAWFIFFAALTVMLFVLGDGIQSSQALRVALQARGDALARQLASEVERRYERAETELLVLGYDVAAGGSIQEASGRFSHVRLLRDGSVYRQFRARLAPKRDSCAGGTVPFTVRFQDRRGHSYRVEAAVSVQHFFEGMQAADARFGGAGITAVLDSETGALVYNRDCILRSDAAPAALEQIVSADVLGQGDSAKAAAGKIADDWLIALRKAQRPGWSAAVMIDYEQFAAPFRAVHAKYLMITVLVMMFALLFVLRMIRNDLRRLAAISTAADAIGNGRFDIWLPPPTNDDVGRLSLSIGRMVNRLSTTMHQMEVGRSMAAVGELATYLSHEIRNPLSSIRLNLQMLRRDLRSGEPPEDAPQLVALCLTELQRLDDVVRTVLELGRKRSEPSDASCYVHDVVLDTIQVMHSKLQVHGIEVVTQFTAAEAAVMIDAARLKSVLINLILNSIDALAASDLKRISITSSINDLGVAQMLVLRVKDTGPGVPAHLRERIFEPFFTTKNTGNGIGLATALRTVVEVGGMLRCEAASEWSRGAEFVLELPCADGNRAILEDTPTAMQAGA